MHEIMMLETTFYYIFLFLMLSQLNLSLASSSLWGKKTETVLQMSLCSTVVHLDYEHELDKFNLQRALMNHSLITLDLHNNYSFKLLSEQILIPAVSKVTYGKYNIFPECVSILLRSDGVEHITKISGLILKTRVHANMIILTKNFSKFNQAIMNVSKEKKPRVDIRLIGVDDYGNLHKHEEYLAINNPGWKTLCVSYTRGSPSTITSANKDITLGKDMYGSGVDTLRAITQRLNVDKLEFHYGKSNNEIATLLGNGTCDLSLGQIAFAYYRYKFGVNFARSMNEIDVRIMYNLPGPIDKFHTLTYPFTSGVWTMVVCSLILIIIFLLLGDWLGDHGVTFIHMFSISLGGLFSEAMPDQYFWVRFRAKSGYIATFTWLTMTCLIVYAYRSTLLASLVSVEYEKPVDTYQDLLDRNILLLFTKGSIFTPMFRYSPDPVHRKVEAESVRRGGTSTPENSAELDKLVDEGKAAFLGIPVMIMGRRHKIGMSREALPTSYTGWYYGLKMPLAREIDISLGWLLDTGTYMTLLQKSEWYLTKPERDHIRSSSDKEEEPLDMVQFIPMILALGAGLVLAISSFVCELTLMNIARKTFLL